MSRRLRVLLVDDEPLAREGLRLRLAREPDLEIVGECEDVAGALTAVETLAPDVVFLDIHLQGDDGFHLLERLPPDALPAVIFVTAYAEHALRAFRVRALDYLVKPFDDETLHASVQTAREHVQQVVDGSAARQMHRLLADIGGSELAGEADRSAEGRLTRVVVKRDGRIYFVETSAIDWLEAAGDYVRVHAGGTCHLLRTTMRELEARLDPRRFVRIHRTTIVALPSIRELQPFFRGSYVVVMRDGVRLSLSRRYRPILATALGTSL